MVFIASSRTNRATQGDIVSKQNKARPPGATTTNKHDSSRHAPAPAPAYTQNKKQPQINWSKLMKKPLKPRGELGGPAEVAEAGRDMGLADGVHQQVSCQLPSVDR